jgi:hypothetical protein
MPYNPGQLRIPRHHEGGGRWTDTHHWLPTTPYTDDPRVILARGPAPATTPVRPPPPTPRPAAPNLPPQPAIPGPALPGMPDLRPPGTPNPALPWTPSTPLLPSPPSQPRSPLIPPSDLLSRQLDWYATLSARNSDDQRAFLIVGREFFRPNSDGPHTFVRVLTAREVGALCEHLGNVQSFTNRAAAVARSYPMVSTPAQFGTAVHWLVSQEIKARKLKSLLAEVSLWKTFEETGELPPLLDKDGNPLPPFVKYGTKGSIRYDAFEGQRDTVCIYDLKTGRRGLSFPRSLELAAKAFENFPAARWIFVTEVRPTSFLRSR